MGYYSDSGQGVVTGGGSVVTLRSSGPDVNGVFYLYQLTGTVVTTRNGVSLTRAQRDGGDMNLSSWTWPRGRVEAACKGWRRSMSYQQIGGSNLYTLVDSTDTIKVRGVQGSYDSGWVS